MKWYVTALAILSSIACNHDSKPANNESHTNKYNNIINDDVDSIQIVSFTRNTKFEVVFHEEVIKIYHLNKTQQKQMIEKINKSVNVNPAVNSFYYLDTFIKKNLPYTIRLFTKDTLFRYATDGRFFVKYFKYKGKEKDIFYTNISFFQTLKIKEPKESHLLDDVIENAQKLYSRVSEVSTDVQKKIYEVVRNSEVSEKYIKHSITYVDYFPRSMITHVPDHSMDFFEVYLGFGTSEGFQPEYKFYVDKSYAIQQVEPCLKNW